MQAIYSILKVQSIDFFKIDAFSPKNLGLQPFHLFDKIREQLINGMG
jgi:hypothetical protein